MDLLIVAERLPNGRLKRLQTRLSPVFRTPEELELGGPLFLDMVEDVLILYDPHDLLRGYLGRLKEDLRRRGARRLRYKGSWYWDFGAGAVRERDIGSAAVSEGEPDGEDRGESR